MIKYTEEMRKFIAANVEGRTNKELAALVNEKYNLGITEGAIKSYKGNHDLKGNTKKGIKKGSPTALFPQHVRDFIEKNYKGNGPSRMAKMLNEKFETNYTRFQLKRYYGACKYNSGLKGSEGIEPPNKCFRFPGKVNRTSFKKGIIPHNKKEIGYEMVDVYGYHRVKVSEKGGFAFKHILIWEKEHGPMPEGHAIIFLDQNRDNLSLDNLQLISKSELTVMNRKSMITSDKDLNKASILTARIKIKTAKLTKEMKK